MLSATLKDTSKAKLSETKVVSCTPKRDDERPVSFLMGVLDPHPPTAPPRLKESLL